MSAALVNGLNPPADPFRSIVALVGLLGPLAHAPHLLVCFIIYSCICIVCICTCQCQKLQVTLPSCFLFWHDIPSLHLQQAYNVLRLQLLLFIVRHKTLKKLMGLGCSRGIPTGQGRPTRVSLGTTGPWHDRSSA
jgi:hypothetical protein